MAREPGRNEPCPCGSGRKYKQCCLRAAENAGHGRLAVRRAEGRIIDAASSYAVRRFGEPFFGQALATFFLGEIPDAELEDIPEFSTMFLPWFVLEFVGDPALIDGRPAWPNQPMARHWLETERPDLTTVERDWLEAASRSPLSAFVVEAVEPGRSIGLRDMLTGRRFHVLEESASRTIQTAHVLFTTVVTVGDVAVMLGAAPFSMPPDWQLRVIDWREMTFGRRRLARRDLVGHAHDIRQLYLDLADDLFNPAPPQLRNTDGDELELTTMNYTLSVPPAEAYARLAPLATIGNDVHEDDEAGVDPRPPEFADIEDELFRQHTLAWIDMKVPALGGITPKVAVRTRAGRERVDALLAGFARGPGASRPAAQQALADVRRVLKLDEPEAGDVELCTVKVTLTGIRPPVWRRLEVPADLTLAQLHRVLQAAMGWTDSHLHLFMHDGIAYGDSRRDLDLGCVNEKTTQLSDLLWEPKDWMEYEYDFCEAMARPAHPEHQALVERFGRSFDPNAFDLEAASAALAKLRLRPGRR